MMTAQNLSEAQRREDDDGVDDAKEQQQQQQQQQQQRRRDEEGARTKENGSNALDIKRTEELDSLLRLEDVYESASECTRREEVLGELNEMLQDWIRTRSLSKGHPDESIRCNLYTFGSYRLGVHGPAADIDSLVIGPKHIDRAEDFFGFEEDDLRRVILRLHAETRRNGEDCGSARCSRTRVENRI